MRKRNILYILIIIELCAASVPAQKVDPGENAEIAGDELADVAILKFINNTGSPSYNWLETSLPDAINDSMKDKFEFRRTAKEWAQGISEGVLENKNDFDIADIRFIAENTSSDIIIFGNYTFDSNKNKITIYTKIFHLSRNSITGVIALDSPVDSSLFNVVDKAAAQCIEHIEKIALEDEARRAALALQKEKAAQEETVKKKEDKGKKKIVLKKVKSGSGKYHYDSWNIDLSIMGSKPGGIISEDLEPGGGLRAGVSNSYGSLWHFGAFLTANFLNNPNTLDIEGGLLYMKVYSFQASVGVNFKFFSRFIFQPYIASGFSLDKVSSRSNFSSGEIVKSYYTFILSAGQRLSVRIFGIFITPFFEYTRIVDPSAEVAMVNMGLGVSF